jgi:hypothetical protein
MEMNLNKSLRAQTVALRLQQYISTTWRIFSSPAVLSVTPTVGRHIFHFKHFAAKAWCYLTLDMPDGIDWWIILGSSC